jgi:hypothetical protein
MERLAQMVWVVRNDVGFQSCEGKLSLSSNTPSHHLGSLGSVAEAIEAVNSLYVAPIGSQCVPAIGKSGLH